MKAAQAEYEDTLDTIKQARANIANPSIQPDAKAENIEALKILEQSSIEESDKIAKMINGINEVEAAIKQAQELLAQNKQDASGIIHGVKTTLSELYHHHPILTVLGGVAGGGAVLYGAHKLTKK